MELTIKQLTDLLILSTETLTAYKEKAEDILGVCECQCKAMPVKDIKMVPEDVKAAISFGFHVEEEPQTPAPTEPTETPKTVPQSEEKPAVDKLPEAPKEEPKKPISDIKAEEPKEAPKQLEPSDLAEPEPSKGGKTKKKLDDGKIFALRRAGWTFEKIADEMGCSAQTAYNHFLSYSRSR